MEEEKVMALEVSLAYLEDMLKELNSVVIQQQKKIDEMGLSQKRITQKMEDIVELIGDDSDPGERPPHY